jgi:Domain of unknown function (DUF4167)
VPSGATGTGNAETPTRSLEIRYDRGVTVKRSRSRGRRPHSNSSGSSSTSSSSNHSNHNNYNPNRTFDSSGPEIKIRGSAPNVYEKYLQLARDANSSGDRVMAENYLQHAEHYFRIMAAQAEAQQQYHQQNGGGGGQQGNRQAGQGDQPYVQNNGTGPAFSLGDNADEEQPEEAGAE